MTTSSITKITKERRLYYLLTLLTSTYFFSLSFKRKRQPTTHHYQKSELSGKNAPILGNKRIYGIKNLPLFSTLQDQMILKLLLSSLVVMKNVVS